VKLPNRYRFAELEQLREMPGAVKAICNTLMKVWNADVDLQALAARGPRIIDLARIEAYIRDHLPGGMILQRELVSSAMANFLKPKQTPKQRSVVCATPKHEVIESLRWARQLIVSGRAQARNCGRCFSDRRLGRGFSSTRGRQPVTFAPCPWSQRNLDLSRPASRFSRHRPA